MKPTPARIEALEKAQTATDKRLDALLLIVEKQSEQLNRLVDERLGPKKDGYQPIFDRWPGNAR